MLPQSSGMFFTYEDQDLYVVDFSSEDQPCPGCGLANHLQTIRVSMGFKNKKKSFLSVIFWIMKNPNPFLWIIIIF